VLEEGKQFRAGAVPESSQKFKKKKSKGEGKGSFRAQVEKDNKLAGTASGKAQPQGRMGVGL